MSPLVSVIVPTYNSSSHLERAVQSIVDQTIDHRQVEIIIVDDCSEDDTWTTIQELANRNDRIRSIRLDHHSRGPGEARNAGVAAATGTWLGFLDADDAFLPEALETMTSTAESRGSDVLSARLEIVVGDQTSIPRIYNDVLPEPIPATTVRKNPELLWPPLGMTTRIFNRSFVQSRAIRCPEGVIAQDSVFTTSALLQASSVTSIPVVVYQYIRDRDPGNPSISDDLDPQYFADWLETRRMIVTLFERYSHRSYWEDRYNIDLFYGVGRLLRYSRELDVEEQQQTALHEVVASFHEFCSHYRSVDIGNTTPFLGVLPMLIGDNDIDEATELIRLSNARRRPGAGGANGGW